MPKLLVLLLVPFFVFAAPKESYVKLGKMPAIKLKIGKTTDVKILFDVAKEYHIQANPASNASLIKTDLTVGKAPGVQPGTVQYPKGVPYKLAGLDEAILVYSEKAEFVVPMTVAADAKVGKTKLVGTIAYQACDDKTCKYPQTDSFELPIQITK